MISAAIFVPRGAAKEVPDRVEISPDEMTMLIEKSNNMNLDDDVKGNADADMDNQSDDDNNTDNEAMNVELKQDIDNSRRVRGKKVGMEQEIMDRMAEAEKLQEEAFLKELNMGNYDQEEEGATVFLGGSNLTVFGTNTADPYITIPDEEDESDDEDLMLKPTDALLCVGRTEEEHSTIEFYVYDETTQNLYVHHDFVVPSFPLCLEWVGADPRSHIAEEDRTQNFLAVGTFQPQIEIWNLDVLDVLEPVATLGGRDAPVAPPPGENKSKKKKKKKKKKKNLKEALLGKLKEGSHSDAVMCMNWHPQHVNRLCSGSADHTIKLWDITTQQCMSTLTHHNDKVQAVKWNPSEPSVLLSGAYDRTVIMCDTRNNSSIKAKVDADIEAVAWNPHQVNQFFATTENGTVTCHDARKINDKPIFTIGAHSKPCTAIAVNCAVPNFFATASIDKTVKLWDMTDNKVQMICSREMKVGSVFSMNFERNAQSPFLLVAGGNKGKVAVWDTTENDNVRARYHEYVPESVMKAPVADDDDE